MGRAMVTGHWAVRVEGRGRAASGAGRGRIDQPEFRWPHGHDRLADRLSD